MLYAISTSGEKIRAEKKKKAFCGLCGSPMLAKCGQIKIWHWAHESKKDCDLWYEPETEWHLSWKSQFSSECVEYNFKGHRADVYNKNGVVIEFQNSSISAEEIKKREEFYGKNMIWVINGKKIAQHFFWPASSFWSIASITDHEFIWKHLHQCWKYSNRKIYIDFGELGINKEETAGTRANSDGLFLITSFFNNPKKHRDRFLRSYQIDTHGECLLIERKDFLNEYLT
ncbi:MAG: hypothetical protein C4518_01385 [Desulfobacteraceae bacterium]|nr:MAG: hypothetical protein C4518_01385 [Desulfobacteraceae bacterium]